MTGDGLLYQNLATKAASRLDDIPATVWSKVIVLAGTKVMTKVYATELSVIVSGAHKEFDDIELGLGAFINTGTHRSTMALIQSLGNGVEIKRDEDGSILARRLWRQPITVRWSPHGYMSEDVTVSRGQVPLGTFIKIFDIKEFRSFVQLQMSQGNYAVDQLLQRCVVGLNLGPDVYRIDSLPCWITVVSLAALRMLEDSKTLEAMSMAFTHMELRDEEDRKEEKHIRRIKAKRQRKRWSRTDHREHFNLKETTSRTLRNELRNKGEKVGDHMAYSWEEPIDNQNVLNMDQLHEKFDHFSTIEPEPYSPTRPKQWAKVDVALRHFRREMIRAMMDEDENVLND